MNFMSDTTAPAHPAILDALARANAGAEPSYGADALSLAVERRLAEFFETDVSVWLAPSGTAANALALSVLCPPIGAVLAHAESHIERDERGAVEFYTGGGRLRLLGGDHAKIALGDLEAALEADQPDFVHETPLAVLSLTNLTECGAAYTAEETRARIEPVRARGLAVHLDGARFANALVSQTATPADLSWRAGVDVITFGATKNGAMGCEAIVLFGAARSRYGELLARAKRAGHMPAKARFLAAQMDAYLADDLWRGLAETANARAKALADGLARLPGCAAVHPVDGNEVFLTLPDPVADALRAAGVTFARWLDGTYRFVCAWSTTEAEVAGAVEAAQAAVRAPASAER